VSKRRLVITAVLAGASQSETARRYDVSQGWVSRLMARYRAEGEAAFEARSRRPRTTPNATPPAVVQQVLTLRKQLTEQGLDAGAEPSPGTWSTTTPPPSRGPRSTGSSPAKVP
jgi:transposase